MKQINKNLILLFLLGLFTMGVYAQVKVGDNPTTINPSAAFEIESTIKGFLPPRMTTAQRDAITAPVNGLVIYNTTKNCTEFFNGTGWYNECEVSITPPIGGDTSSGGTAVVSEWNSAVGCSVGAGADNSPAGKRRGG